MLKHKKIPWHHLEFAFLALFLFERILLFLDRLGTELGWDTGAHLEMISLYAWSDLSVGIHESFYSYHPPLGFLFARTLHLTGLSPLMSVQILSFIASLVAFFFLRATLKQFDLLSSPIAMAFLYVTSSIPLQIYLLTSVNLDVLILALASVVLYCSIRIFWKHQKSWELSLGLLTALAVALLTKFSGWILLSIPLLCALTKPRGLLDEGVSMFRHLRHPLRTATLTLFSVTILTFPYYHHRYFASTGTFFPSNTDTWIGEHREKRDEAPFTFIKNVLFAPKAHAEGTALEAFRFEGLRLYDIWNSFWARSTDFADQSETSRTISRLYLTTTPFLAIIGLVLALCTARRRPSAWNRLSIVLLSFTLIQFLALLWYIYQNPYGDWIPAKAAYIAPAMLGIGFLLAQPFAPFTSFTPKRTLLQTALFALIALFIVINHSIPVY